FLPGSKDQPTTQRDVVDPRTPSLGLKNSLPAWPEPEPHRASFGARNSVPTLFEIAPSSILLPSITSGEMRAWTKVRINASSNGIRILCNRPRVDPITSG